MKARLILLVWALATGGCRGVETRPVSGPAVHAVTAEPERSPSSAPAGGAAWVATIATESNLGPLDCYSQAALDDCASRTQPAPQGTCGQIGAVQTIVVQAGMACTNCLTDCWCRATMLTHVCR